MYLCQHSKALIAVDHCYCVCQNAYVFIQSVSGGIFKPMLNTASKQIISDLRRIVWSQGPASTMQ